MRTLDPLNGMKIQGKLTLALTLFGTLLVVAMAIPFHREMVRTLENRQYHLLETVLDSRMESIRHSIELRQEQARKIARTWLPSRIEPGVPPDNELKERLEAHLTGILHSGLIGMVDPESSPDNPSGWVRLTIRGLDGEKWVESGFRSGSENFTSRDREDLSEANEVVQLVWAGPNRSEPRLKMIQPVIHAESGRQSAYLVVEMRLDWLNSIALDRTGLGESGEVMVFAETGEEYRLLTPLIHETLAPSPLLELEGVESKGSLSLTREDLQAGVREGEMARSVTDYRGVEVRCEWAAMPGLNWIVATKMDRSELFTPIVRMNQVVGWSLAGILLFAMVLAWAMARTLSEPIEKLTFLFGKISRGEAVQPVRVMRKDELGELAQRANDSITYLNRIRHHADRITKGDTHGTLAPLDPRDRLGRALEAMTFSIRRYRSRIARLLRESRRQNRRLNEQRSEIERELVIRQCLQQRLLEAHDRERQHVGRELHDGLGQMLTGIRMVSEQLASSMRIKGDARAEDVAEISTLIQEADEFVRTLSRGMALQDVTSAGLDTLILNLCENMEKLFGVQARLLMEGELELEGPIATAIYRIVQEAVTNAVRHADPDWVEVRIAEERRDVRFSIRNNGKPFRSSEPDREGVGLQTMAYRASALGGELKIESESDGVTSVHGRIPYQKVEVSG